MISIYIIALFAALSVAHGAQTPMIIGGSDVAPAGKWSHQGSVQIFGQHFCGASLISDTWVLTSAHCVHLQNLADLTVVLGMHDRRSNRRGNPETYNVKQKIEHELFNLADGHRGFPNDIALIKLSSPANVSSEFIGPVALAAEGDDFYGSECVTTGWGVTLVDDSDESLSNVLKEAPVSTFTQDECREFWTEEAIGDYHLCTGRDAGDGEGDNAPCGRDDGGPLVCKKDGDWVLAGVGSWGYVNCYTHAPYVFANVPYFRQWIKDRAGL